MRYYEINQNKNMNLCLNIKDGEHLNFTDGTQAEHLFFLIVISHVNKNLNDIFSMSTFVLINF